MRHNLFLTTALIITPLLFAGCGKNSTSTPPSPVIIADTTPPTINISPSKSSIESGETVVFSITITDNSGEMISPVFTCTGGMLDGYNLITEKSDLSSSISCSAMATDSNGNSAQVTEVIEVSPTITSLNSLSEDQFVNGKVKPGQLVVLSAENLDFGDDEEFSGDLSGLPVLVSKDSSKTVSFQVPFEIESGKKIVTVDLGSAHYSIALEVDEREGFTDPLSFLNNEYSLLLSDIDNLIASEEVSPAQRASLIVQRAGLTTHIDNLSNSNDQQLQEEAQLYSIHKNVLERLLNSTGSNISSNKTSGCSQAAIKAIATAVFGGITFASGAIPLGYLFYTATALQLKGVFEECSMLDTTIESVLQFDKPSEKFTHNSVVYQKASGIVFLDGLEEQFNINVSTSFPEDIRENLVVFRDDVLEAMNLIPLFSSEEISDFEKLKEGTEVIPPIEIGLGSIEVGFPLSGLFESNTTSVTGVFDYLGANAVGLSPRQSFSFEVLRNDQPLEIFDAEIAFVPDAPDYSVQVLANETTQIDIPSIGETLEILTTSGDYTIDVLDHNSILFIPDDGFSGDLQVKYQMISQSQISSEGTVAITVEDPSFEGAWSLQEVYTTTGPESVCNNGTQTFSRSGVVVTKINSSTYEIFGGNLVVEPLQGELSENKVTFTGQQVIPRNSGFNLFYDHNIVLEGNVLSGTIIGRDTRPPQGGVDIECNIERVLSGNKL